MTARMPAVAGLFYPGDAADLRAAVDHLLGADSPADAPTDAGARTHGPGTARAVIAPHAGYVYSGSTAAVAYRALALAGARRIAVVGPTHRVAIDGIAGPQADVWRTPLGDVPVELPEAVAVLPHVVRDDRPHAPEHSVEVHVPFLQRLAPQAAIVPLVVGRSTPEDVADVIGALLGEEGTSVVISSDLSHYLPYEQARRVDRATLDQVVALDGRLGYEQACGAMPVNGLVEHARRRGGRLRELASCSSGDTAGDRARVVGYAALALEDHR